MSKPKIKTRNLNIRISKEQSEEIKNLSDSLGISKTAVIILAVKELKKKVEK